MAKPEWLYGLHTVRAIAERHPERILELYTQQGRDQADYEALLDAKAVHGFAHRTVTKQVLDGLVEGNHQGVAVRARLAQPLGEPELLTAVESADAPVLLLVLDGVTDPQNLGACIRTAAAAGATGIIAPKDKAVGLTPVVRRVAVGTAEIIPFYQVTNLARSLKAVQALGVWVVGTALDDNAEPLHQIDLSGHLALVMGAEGSGLRRLTRETCDRLAYIPMHPHVDSLNVSVATGVALFEARRQRSL